MKRFSLSPRDWSIRWKLTHIAMGTAALALLLTVAGLTMFEYFNFRQQLMERLETLGQVVGGNSTAAIAFNRPDDATATLATLAAQKNIQAACIYNGEGEILAHFPEHAAGIPAHPWAQGRRVGPDSMEVMLPVELDGKSVGMVYLRSNLEELRQRLYEYCLIAPVILAIASCAGLLLVNRLQRYVSAPIMSLAETARRVSQEKDYRLRAQKHGQDELGRLADAFNEMLEGIRQRDAQIHLHLDEVQAARSMLEERVQARTADLTRANEELHGEMERRQEAELKREQMQAGLVEVSRRAGMADVATGVLHNVGNVLNSVNVSTQLVHDAVKSSHIANLFKAADLIEQHEQDLPGFFSANERGRQLPGFLVKLARALEKERSTLLSEIDDLTSNVNHVREIVSMQQSLARVAGVSASVTLGELIDDALKINQAGISRHGVDVMRDYDPKIRITTDRHKVLQVLINLISNAKYALSDRSAATRLLTIRARIKEGSLEIAVMDNGVGIEAQGMERIFQFGYTTKKNGHGFGLHSCALAARELGGSLSAHSDGAARGATFTLLIPLSKEAAHV
jgi:C4-dicarboxylate-specific signal transduction histidine kinase